MIRTLIVLTIVSNFLPTLRILDVPPPTLVTVFREGERIKIKNSKTPTIAPVLRYRDLWLCVIIMGDGLSDSLPDFVSGFSDGPVAVFAGRNTDCVLLLGLKVR